MRRALLSLAYLCALQYISCISAAHTSVRKGSSRWVHKANYSSSHALSYYGDAAEWNDADTDRKPAAQDLQPSGEVQHCLKQLDQPHQGDPKTGLAIVVSVSPDRISEVELQHATDNVKRYAEAHGYSFYLQTSQTGKLVHFFSARWLDLVVSETWQKHEWVLHLDGDSIFLDFKRDLGTLLSSSQHLFWQIRLNKEVTAAVALIRTSAFSECFVRMWGAKGVFSRANSDNGDLLSTLLDFVDPSLAQRCDRHRDTSYGDYIDCFAEAHGRLLALHRYMPITVFAPLAGFWKSLEGLHDHVLAEKEPHIFKLLMRCWSSDLLGHGSKSIGTWAWWTREDQNVLHPKCLYNTPEEELQLARECCLWHFPGCVRDGDNVCREASHCANSTGTIMQCSRRKARMLLSQVYPVI